VVSAPILTVGIILLPIAIIAYNFPLSVTLADTTVNLTIPETVAFCASWAGQFGQILAQVVLVCSEYNNLLMGIYGAVLLGIALIIVGLVKKSKKIWICEHCNYALTSEVELINHKNEKHLDKSQFVCEHCDFIAITEKALWNHYDNKHPDKKKWE